MINYKNVFDFIDNKLAFGVGEHSHYLTPIGAYIVGGSDFKDWKRWAINFGVDSDYGVEDLETCPSEIAEKIKKECEEDKEEWMNSNGVTEEDLDKLDLLHEQYLAIVQYANNRIDENAVETIDRTYRATGINCLKYLVSLKTQEQWHYLSDFHGAQLCAVFTGFDPNNDPNNKAREAILSKMHYEFCYYANVIDNIVLSKTSQDENDNSKTR